MTFFGFVDNVNEYLKLASNADKTQVQRIKAVFEKKNQKSAQCIQQLQKKLESYNKKLKELETKGVQAHHHRQPREVLRDMGQGLKYVICFNLSFLTHPLPLCCSFCFFCFLNLFVLFI